MVSKRYSMAISETLHYLKGIKKEDLDKIPSSFMEFLKMNANPNYKCDFNYTKPLKDLQLLPETRGIISAICLNYWCETKEQKDEFLTFLKENETANNDSNNFEKLIERNYLKADNKTNVNDEKITQKKIEEDNSLAISHKNGFFEKIRDFFKKFFKVK